MAVTLASTGVLFPDGGTLTAPGNAPLFGCRAWARINSSGTLLDGGNISSTSGVAPCTVTMATALPSADYTVVCGGMGSSGSTRYLLVTTMVSSSQFQIQNGGNLANGASVAVFK